ncbi:MAG: hypothetical protein M3O82_06295, partial [Verrucomicrobiota bacterium]|nr:hypothetical protein [Verrucomicrobiota bacterium]
MSRLSGFVALLFGAGAISLFAETPTDSRAEERDKMVQRQIANRGVTDARVLAAMRKVPRHEFIPSILR